MGLFSVPNLFTLLRLALAPVVIMEIVRGRHFAALAIFALAAATDIVDGPLARRYHACTQAGAYLDPIADKVLLSGVYLALAIAGIVPRWFVGLIFGRDVLILLASAIAFLTTRLRRFPPSRWGKASTFFQILTAVAWMSRGVAPNPFFNSLAMFLIWPTSLLTVWSGVDYGWRGVRSLRSLQPD